MRRKRTNDGDGAAPATLADVAARAGVSKMTASRALSNSTSATLRPETRRRILEAASALGYKRNPLAGGLTGSATGVVAILVPDLANAVFSDLIAGIQDSLAGHEKQTIVARTGFEPQLEHDAIRRLLPWKPDAFVLAGPERSPETVALLRGRRVACVETMDLPDDPIDMAVGFHHADAGRMAADHLHEIGARRPAALMANFSDRRARTRIRAFADRFEARAGVVVPCCEVDAPATIAVGRALCARLLDRDRPDALFAANDLLAAGAYIECLARGVRVPDEMAICGFNDLPLSADLFDGLTTVHSPRREIGRRVADLIAEPRAAAVVHVGCRLVRRGTT